MLDSISLTPKTNKDKYCKKCGYKFKGDEINICDEQYCIDSFKIGRIGESIINQWLKNQFENPNKCVICSKELEGMSKFSQSSFCPICKIDNH